MTSELTPIDTSRGAEILRTAIAIGSPDPSIATAVRQDLADETDALPYIVYRRVDVARDIGLDGTLLGVTETYQIECWGETRDQEMTMENRIVDLLLAAGWAPRQNDTDGYDPKMMYRAGVIIVDIDL